MMASEERVDLEKYRRYLMNDFGPRSTIADIFETVYYDTPHYLLEIKEDLAKRISEEIANPALEEKERRILLDEFIPPNVTYGEILQVVFNDAWRRLICGYQFERKRLLLLKEYPSKK